MRSKLLLVFVVMLAFMLYLSGCGSSATCPTCGTTVNGAYAPIVIIPVPEHNPTGEPGGPFNSFDISVADSKNHRFFVSDRIGLDVVAVDTQQNLAVNFFSGANGVAGGGINFSVCHPSIPPLLTALGNYTRFGCRTQNFAIPGFGTMGGIGPFGGFPGAQCCAARANGVNPLSGPDGEVLSPDNNSLFVGNGSSSVAVFDLTTTTFTSGGALPPAPMMIAHFPTGQSPDYDGCAVAPCTPNGTTGSGHINPNGISPCISSANGRAFSDPTCGDLRADEMSIGVVSGHTLLLVANGDPAFPFVTIVDVTEIVGHSGTPTDALGGPHCMPVNLMPDGTPVGPYAPPDNAVFTTGFPNGNFPRCILGQIYYDGAGANNAGVAVDSAPAFCPDPSNFFDAASAMPVPSGVSGTGVGVGGRDVPCHHGPIIDQRNGTFCAPQTAGGNGGNCVGAIAIAGIGGSAFNPNTGHFLVTNASASPSDLRVGTVDEIDPRLSDTSCGGRSCGPVVINTFPVPNCMPSGIVQGPGNNFLVGCADHDGEAFPPNEYVINGTTGKIIATIDKVGGVDETWYNPGDNRYYLAARDMPGGPVMGVIDAGTNQWLVNVTTNSNSHSISVDSSTNHVFVPLQSGGICGTQSSNGCIGVFAQQ